MMDEKREDGFSGLPPKLMQTAKKFWDKLMEIWNSPKRIQLLLVLGTIGIGLIFCSEIGEKKETTLSIPQQEDSEMSSSLSQENQKYLLATEKRLEEIIGQIDGVGECSVMVTLKEGSCNIYASQQKTSQDQSREQIPPDQLYTQNQNTSEQTLVIVEDQNGSSYPVIEKTIEPQINGVIVVCQGAKSSRVCQLVTEAVTTVLGMRSTQVCVLPKNR